jgi:periplasmic protein TonB
MRNSRGQPFSGRGSGEGTAVVPPFARGPVFDLGGTESESNAIVLGERILPAMKDDKFRNRPPVYPVEAEIRGEHGSVVIVIHVSEHGVATGADVAESSGYDVLDQAAIVAVRKWHFHPAMREGQPIPLDMPFRVTFEPY